MQSAVLEENASAFVMGHSWFQQWTESFKIGVTEHLLSFKQRRLTLVMANLDRLNGHFEYSDSNKKNNLQEQTNLICWTKQDWMKISQQ